ncbi:MAG: hypothetical protein NZ455_10350 [Bacteroidia bacterium]|nr:hypothetical protein [Bacteroidia bacterium]MDW8345597.1 hypothetical protein [Bacteroidia bacterium]
MNKIIILSLAVGFLFYACRPKDEQILIDFATFDIAWASTAGLTSDLKQKALQDIKNWENEVKKVQDSAYGLEQWSKIKNFSRDVYGYDSAQKKTIHHIEKMKVFHQKLINIDKQIAQENISINALRKRILEKKEGTPQDKIQLAQFNEKMIIFQEQIYQAQKEYKTLNEEFEPLINQWKILLSYAFPKKKKEERALNSLNK